MANVTLAVPEELHREMRSHPEIKWSTVIRAALRREVTRLHLYDRLLAQSRLTEKDAIELGRKIRRDAASRRQ
jgi:hypothetical protein